MTSPSLTDLENARQLGTNLRALRQQAGLTQAELAKSANLSRAYLAALERGFSSATKAPPHPSRSLLRAIAAALGVDLAALRDDSNERKSEPVQPHLWEAAPGLQSFEAIAGETTLQPGRRWTWPEAEGVIQVEANERADLGLESNCQVLVRRQNVGDAPEGLCLIAQGGTWRWERIARIQQRAFSLAPDGSYQPLAPDASIVAQGIAIIRQI